MAISRFKTSTLAQGLPKYQKLWDGTSVVVTGAYQSIATATLSSTQSSITFSSIPQGYKHLQIRALIGYTGSVGSGYIAFNGDNASGNYSYHAFGGDGASAGTASLTSQNQGKYTGYAGTSPQGRNAMIINIPEYSNTAVRKITQTFYGWAVSGQGYSEIGSNQWRSTSAITSITFTPANTFDSYTSIALYGIKG